MNDAESILGRLCYWFCGIVALLISIGYLVIYFVGAAQRSPPTQLAMSIMVGVLVAAPVALLAFVLAIRWRALPSVRAERWTIRAAILNSLFFLHALYYIYRH